MTVEEKLDAINKTLKSVIDLIRELDSRIERLEKVK